MKISILLPTRGRPQNMEKMWQSAKSLAFYPNDISVFFYVDDDDFVSIDQLEKMNEADRAVSGIVGPRIVMSDMTNKLYEVADGDIIMYAGDDIIFRTDGWDNKVMSTFSRSRDKIMLVGGHDGYNENTITHGFLHRNWIDTVGYVVPAGYVGDYADTWVDDLARRINRHFRINILIEHMHWAAGKGPFDRTMQEKTHRTYNQGTPAQVKYQQDTSKRIVDAAKLQKFIEEYQNV